MAGRHFMAIGMALLCLGLGACGSTSSSPGGEGPQLSQGRYNAALARVTRKEFQAQAALFAALRSRSRAALEKGLNGYRAEQEALAAEVASLNPPDDARSANEALAGGLEDTASAVRRAVHEVAGAPSLAAAMRAIQKSKAGEAGTEVREAFAELAKAGYRIGG